MSVMFQLVYEAPRCCNDKVRDLVKLMRLFYHVNAASDHTHAQIKILACKHLELFSDLVGQLSGWGQN